MVNIHISQAGYTKISHIAKANIEPDIVKTKQKQKQNQKKMSPMSSVNTVFQQLSFKMQPARISPTNFLLLRG